MADPVRQPPLVLASASPRRLDLLKQIGIVPDRVDPAHIDERAWPRELPATHARRMAAAKAEAVAQRHRGAVVLAADTVVACGRRIVPKPDDVAAARRGLELLSGRRHHVLGAVAVIDAAGRRRERLVDTVVQFKRLGAGEIESYLATGEWADKAGGYAIQGHAALLIKAIHGSYPNVVGLPLAETYSLLLASGWQP
ncbi:MAG: septum formation protein Maf [Alphaproteobacteria bacterium]|nr:septum formation protein Maf [Alphaproteobacteria bacterium]